MPFAKDHYKPFAKQLLQCHWPLVETAHLTVAISIQAARLPGWGLILSDPPTHKVKQA